MPKVLVATTQHGAGFLQVDGDTFHYVDKPDDATTFPTYAEAQDAAKTHVPANREFVMG